MSDPNLRLALCTAGELYGGVERFVCEYSMYLRDNAPVDVMTVVFYEGELASRLRDTGLDVVVLLPRMKYDPVVVRRLVKLFKAREISLVHTHGYLGTVLGAVAGKLCGAKVIKTEHGKREPCVRRDFAWFRMHANQLADRCITGRFVDHVVYVSDDLRKSWNRNNDGGRHSVIHNGIPPISVDESSAGVDIDDAMFNIGIVGRLGAVKGHIYILRALLELQHRENVRLYVFGEGSLERDLRAFCSAHDLTGCVHFMGFRHDVLAWVEKLDVLVMPSLHEGLPYALLEAMWLGTPVIASRVGGLAEVLEDGTDALLVEAGNEHGLAAAIERAMKRPDLGISLAANARAKVEKLYTTDSMTRDYLCLYDSVCKKPANTMSLLP